MTLLNDPHTYVTVMATDTTLSVALVAFAAWKLSSSRTVLANAPTPAGPLVVTAAVAAVLVLLLTALSFDFVHDDFGYLLAARDGRWEADPQGRFLGVQLPFWIAVRSGHPDLVMALACVAAALGCAAALSAVLTADGRWTKEEARLAGLLFLVTEPVLRLTVWGAGAQQLMAWALILVVIWAGRQAIVTATDAQSSAWTALALGAAGPAALCKWQIACVAAPGLYLWTATLPRRPRLQALLPLRVAFAMAVPMIASGANPAGSSTDISHVLASVAAVGSTLVTLAITLALMLTAPLRLRVATTQTSAAWARGLLRRPSDLAIQPLLMAVLFVLPFLFHDRPVFAEYYFGASLCWLVALAAPLLLAAVEHSRRQWLVAALALGIWFPWHALDNVVSPTSVGHTANRWLAEVSRAIPPAFVEGTVAITSRCDTPEDTRRSEVTLRRAYSYSESGAGLRWLRPGANITLVLDRAAATNTPVIDLEYCETASPHVTLTHDHG